MNGLEFYMIKSKNLWRLASIVFLILLLTDSVNAQLFGNLRNESFSSESLGESRNYSIYFPVGYDQQNTNERYPVIYFLHGAEVDQTAYNAIKNLLDYMIFINSINKLIMVLPDGSVEPYAGSFYTNSELYGNYKDYIVYDLINHIDNTYNTIENPNQRAIAGHSMGAYGSMKIALLHPELFAAVASHSGPLNLDLTYTFVPEVLEENGGQAPYNFFPDPSKNITFFMYTLSGAFSPNLSNPPDFVDLPLNNNGEIIPAVLDRWRPHNVSEIARSFNPGNKLAIYFDCGENDQFNLMVHNTSFRDTLQKYGISFQFDPHIGGHIDMLIIQASKSIEFIDDVFQNPTAVQKTYDNFEKDRRINVYPVPARDIINVEFYILNAQNINIRIYNPSGKILSSGNIHYCNSGKNTINISVTDLPPGIYLVSVNGNEFYESRIIELIDY